MENLTQIVMPHKKMKTVSKCTIMAEIKWNSGPNCPKYGFAKNQRTMYDFHRISA
jgi:hypothetical protein